MANQLQSIKIKSGIKITYVEYGDSNGYPLFYFHGWPGSSAQGAILSDVAKNLGLRIIAGNRPGILGSDYIPNRKLADWPAMILDLADCLKLDKFSVLGLSGGGPYALACAWGMPKTRLEQVIVVSGAPLLAVIAGKEHLHSGYRALLWLKNNCRWLLVLLLNFIALLLPLKVHRKIYGLMAKKLPPRDYEALVTRGFMDSICKSVEDHLGSGANILISDAEIYLNHPGFDLSEIKRKVTFWHGKLDKNIGLEIAERMASHIEEKDFYVTEDDGHYSLGFMDHERILRHHFAT